MMRLSDSGQVLWRHRLKTAIVYRERCGVILRHEYCWVVFEIGLPQRHECEMIRILAVAWKEPDMPV